jgi:hypothetical protein
MLKMSPKYTKKMMTNQVLENENRAYTNTGGRSQEIDSVQFLPAFYDQQTAQIFPSCFANGQLAPIHILDGLPDACVLERDARGKVLKVKASVISGFVKCKQFYTRAQAVVLLQSF